MESSDDYHRMIQDKIQIAACAVLLEIAWSDDEFSPEEKTIIVETLRREFDLSAAAADDLMARANSQTKESIDTWNFTHTLNQNLSQSERLKIIETIWKIIYSDDHLSQHEDSLVHKLSYLLGLTHSQLIEAKLRVHPL